MARSCETRCNRVTQLAANVKKRKLAHVGVGRQRRTGAGKQRGRVEQTADAIVAVKRPKRAGTRRA